MHSIAIAQCRYFFHTPWKRLLAFIFISSATLVPQAMAAPAAEDEIAEVAMNEISRGELLFKSSQGKYHPAILMETSAEFDINGLVASVQLKQHFRNNTNDYVEGIYVFPLPENAAVNKMSMQVGNRVIRGEIKEKQQAKKIYQQAKAAGKRTSLVSQSRPNMFTNRVANIPPGETIIVELTFIQRVHYESGDFSLRLPLTITPRYIPGEVLRSEPILDESYDLEVTGGWGKATFQVPDAEAITPYQLPASELAHKVKINGKVNLGMGIYYLKSDYHKIKTKPLKRDESSYKFSLVGPVPANRDFVLHWQPEPDNQPALGFFTETVANEEYGLLMLLPPTQPGKAASLPREVIYIIDTSGSMAGVSIEQAKQSLLVALAQLSPKDKFNIIEFNSHMRPLHHKAIPATADAIYGAKHFVLGLAANGGTRMYPALDFALNSATDESSVRQIVFMTDGAIGNEEALLQLIEQKLGNSRLFTVGIGSAPNSYFMQKAAQLGRGTHTYIGDLTEVSSSMQKLFNRLTSPVATNIQIQWPDPDVEMYPAKIPDLYLDEPLLVSAKLGHSKQVRKAKIKVTGESRNRRWTEKVNLKDRTTGTGISTIWARSKIASLLDQKRRGGDEARLRPEILKVALTHHLLSPYTSFVAVEDVISRDAARRLKTKPIPNLMPEGSAQFAFPATATGLWQHLLQGVLLLVCGALIMFWKRASLSSQGL